jgi:hypothetical protein
MKRWHSPRERALMLRRWRQEIAKHEDIWFGQAPLPPTADADACHCYRGMGFLRKRKPFDCGNPRCGICHFDKYRQPKARARKVRQAIEFDVRASVE